MDYIVSTAYDGKLRRLYTKQCQLCEKEMLVPQHVNKKYCSKECMGKAKRTAKEYTCAQCTKVFSRSDSKASLSKSGYQFCSRTCKDTAQRIGGIEEIHPRHYLTSNGMSSYKVVAIRHYGNVCMVCGNEAIWNNKPIILDVHHIDGNRENNNLDNLKVVCPNCHRQEEMEKWSKTLTKP